MEKKVLIEEYADKILKGILKGKADQTIDTFMASKLPISFKMQVLTLVYATAADITGTDPTPCFESIRERLKAGGTDEQGS